ncbi:hypothetical protein F66182_9135 [Fusarium sp. NRRL 66182]|nr:hypothetical protein F66182_9135 [Fusarium sp. NRRL 66182]
MDFIKNAVSGNKDKTASGGASTDASKPAQGGTDYVDKGAAFLSQKAGFNISKDQQEKATDFARGQYEKQTGNKVDPKISN